jgi:2-(3-amino-3-carboxypropyl)histidine synthase
MFDLDIDSVVGIIKEKQYKRVAIQLPEGLKDQGVEIAETITGATSCEVMILGDPCYGACDLADSEALALGCDALFHFGHSQILKKTLVPVHYIEVRIHRDPIPLLSKNLKRLPENLGLVTTIQHVHLLDKIKSFLEESGITVRIGEAKGRAAYSGQVLGCSFSSTKKVSDEVDAFLYIGTGNFHPLGVALSTGKNVFVLDLERGEIRDIDNLKEPILRRRFAAITRAQEAKSFGIIIGEKLGQRRVGLAKKVREMLEENGISGSFIALREINPEVLLPFRRLDAFVNTACPRITIDDTARYKKPVLTPIELEIVLGLRDWDDYEMDEIV